MSVTIQDDMWCSAQAMQGRQGDDLLLALIRYGFTGEEPKEGSRIYPSFLLCKERIDMSASKSSKARRMAEARWGKHDAQEIPMHDATASAKHNAQACTSMMHEHDAEVSRGEVSRGE